MSLILHLSFDDLPPGPVVAPEDMNEIEATGFMVERFTTQWGATTVVRLDNEQFSPPAVDQPWVSVTFLNVLRQQSTFGQAGNRLWFHRDVFRAEVAVPRDAGVLLAKQLANLVCSIFEGYRNGGLYVTTCVPSRVGNDGTWFRVVVNVTFNYHERK